MTIMNNEQIHTIQVELSNVVSMVNGVLNQISADVQSSLRAGATLNPAMEAYFLAAAGELAKLQADVEDAVDRLQDELDPTEAADRFVDIAVNCEQRISLVDDARQVIEGMLAAGLQADAERTVVDFQAKLRDFRVDATAVVDRPSADVLAAVGAQVNDELTAINAGGSNGADLDTDAIERLSIVAAQWADQSPTQQLWATRGALMEELVEAQAQRLVEELNQSDPTASYRFFPAGSLADRTNGVLCELSDGFIGRFNDAGDLQIYQAFEAKAGGASARELFHRKSNPTENGLDEATNTLQDNPGGATLQAAEALNRQTEFAGQLEATKARLETGDVFVNGARLTQEERVRVTACVPSDVAQKRGDVLRVAVTSAELTSLANTCLEAYSAARAEDERRRAAR